MGVGGVTLCDAPCYVIRGPLPPHHHRPTQHHAAGAGLRRRELLVLDTVLGAGVPLAGLVGGGYAADLTTLAERHMHLHRAALRMWREHGL